jgi:hypothetical protein
LAVGRIHPAGTDILLDISPPRIISLCSPTTTDKAVTLAAAAC